MPTFPPIAIKNRPFAIEPETGVMLPDGIFDSCIYNLELACFITNISNEDLGQEFWVRLNNSSLDDWKRISPWMIKIGPLVAGASILVKWRCDFRNTAPGKKEITIEFGGPIGNHGVDGYVRQKIFVSRTSYDAMTDMYICEVPEGKLAAKFEKSIYSRPSTINHLMQEGKEIYNLPIKLPPIPLPIQVSATVFPFAGHEDELPFNDPWWKIVAWIVAFIAAIAAIIAAKNGQGEVGITIKGYGDDNPTQYDWCQPEGKGGMTTAGILSLIAGWAIKVGMMDQIDPWQRGKNETALLLGESTISEKVDAIIEVPLQIKAGSKFEVPIDWSYRRITNQGRELIVEHNEIGFNEHIVENVEINTPVSVGAFDSIIAKIRIQRPDKSFFKGDEIYGTAVFISPEPASLVFQIPLSDSGNGYDETANDGWFTAGLNLEKIAHSFSFMEEDHRGIWTILFFAQNVNDADSSMQPQIAATHVGGNVLVSPYSINMIKSDNSVANEPTHKCDSDKKLQAEVMVN